MSERWLKVEFYDDDRLVETVKTSSAPRPGEIISIHGNAWEVERVTWALDWAQGNIKQLRANVDLNPFPSHNPSDPR